MALFVTSSLSIPDVDLTEQFIRASGPGGQNVNKVATAVQLRFNLGGSAVLTPAVKARLRIIAGNRLTSDDIILIQADRHRTQKANREDAGRRLAQMIREALVPPKPRHKTRPSKGVLMRRAEAKKQRGAIKAARRRPPLGDND